MAFFVHLLILGIVAQAYGRPQEISPSDDIIRVPDPNCLRNHQLLPHEYDCTKFYYCEDGYRHIEPRDCAPGTEFSESLEVCIHPSLANCTLPGVPTVRPSTTGPTTVSTAPPTPAPTAAPTSPTSQRPSPSTAAPTTRPTAPPTHAPTAAPTSPSTQRPSPGETLPNGCPADFSEELLLPHEYDCGQYYHCVHGNKILRPCAIGSHFSYIHQDCVSSDIANCTLSGEPTGVPSTSAPTIRPTSPPTPAPTGAPTAPSTQRPSPGETLPNGCPADFSEELLLPHEYDCGQYYQCVHGNKILRPCAIGSHFSYIYQDCVSADVANCTLSGGPTGGPSTDAPTARPTTSPTPAPTAAPTAPSTQRPSPGETLPNGCPADFSEELLLPHEYDCGQYYQCVHGNKILRPCAIGSHFSYIHQDCVSADEANCTLSGGPTGGPSTGAPTTRPTAPPTPSPTAAPTSPSTQRPSPGETLPNGCPADFSEELLLPHEYDCGQYYQCVHGNKILRPCAIGSHFSYIHQDCVSAEEANCTLSGEPTGGPSTGAPTTRPTAPPTPAPTVAPTGAPTAPSTQRPSPGETLPNGCPADFSEELLLPHEYDCGQYYQCVHGNKILRPCAIGSHFSYIHQDCISADVANCTLSGRPTLGPSTDAPTARPTARPTAPSTPSPTAAPTSPSTQRPSPGETLPNGCPADFSEELLLPHEYDCGHYYQCVHGNKILRPCAIGSHFSYIHQDCVSAHEANCTLSGGPTGGPSTGAPTTRPTAPPTPAPTAAPTSPSTQRPSPGETLPNGCPADFNEELLLPHEYDCGQYYQCVHGNKILRPCAIGSHFSYIHQDCVSADEANCTLSGGPTGGPSTSVPTTRPTALPTPAPTGAPTSPSTQRPSPGETLPNGCPADFSEELLLPHEYDCGQYYQCVHGNKILRPCAIGSHFSYIHQDCVSADEANCTLSGGPTGGPSTGTPTTRPTVPPTSSPTAAPTSPSTQRPSPGETLPNGCPADFSEELLLPHEYDCGQYYQCVHGNKILRPCAIGSHFSYIHQDCVSADEANCTLSGGPTGAPSTAAPTTRPTAPTTPLPTAAPTSPSSQRPSPSTGAPTTTPTVPPTLSPTGAPTSPSTQRPSPGEILPNGCPADFSEELLLPHEYDCGQYYQCVHGNKVLRPCAIGSHFSYNHQDCVSPDVANCTLSGGPTGGPSTGAPTTRPTVPSTHAPTGAPTAPSTQRPSPGETLPNGCPADFSEELLLPHEYDCGQYYQCVHGNKVLRPCAIGSHFSYNHQDCVSAEEANCTLSGGPTGSPSTSAPTTRPTVPSTPAPTVAPTAPTSQRPSPSTASPTTRPTAPPTPSPTAAPTSTSTQRPSTSTGAPTTRPTAPPTPAPTAAPTSPSTQRPSPGETLPNGCPADFSEELLLPHEYDCGQYYQCVHGNKVLRPCAIGSHFSYNHQDCVSAEEANCTLSGGPTGSPSTSAPTTRPTVPSTPAPTVAPTAPTSQRPSPSTASPTTRPTAPPTPSPTAAPTSTSTQRPSTSTGAPTTRPTAPPTPAPTAAPTSPSTQRPSPGETLPNGCPADFGEELLLPHEYDCGQYYQCVHGNRVLRPCAIGSHFSYNHQDCVSPDEANCTLSGGPTGGPSTGAPITRPTAPPTPSPTGAPTSPTTQRPGETLPNGCPADFSEELLLPHEYDCGQYYQCVHGNKVLRPCAIGSHFSYNHQDCVSPDEANCTLSGGPTASPSTSAPTTRPTVPSTPAPTEAPTASTSQRPSPSTAAPTTRPTAPPTPSPTAAPTSPSTQRPSPTTGAPTTRPTAPPTPAPTAAPTSPSTQRPSPGETLPNGCPADFGEELLLPHEYDCGQYYQCVHGNRVLRPCAIGSHFSYIHQDCVSPDEANCTLSGGPTGGPSTGAPITRPTAPPTPSPTGAPTSPTTQRPGETLPNGCPADFSEELLLPHEYDCGQYYQCVHGNKVLRPCAIGSHFSYNHQDCVSPDEANCTLSGGPTASPSTSAPTTRPTVPSTPAPTEAPTASTSQRPSPSTAAPTTRPTAPTTPSPTAAPTSPSTQRPSPTTGAPTTRPTAPPTPAPTAAPTSPSTQRPSPTTDAPTSRPTAPPTPAPTAAPTSPSTQRPSPTTSAPTTRPTVPPTPAPTAAPTSPSTQRPSPGETLPNGCPADFGEELLLPHEYDCGQYYQCVHGNRVLRPCAIGSHFSYNHQDCVSPDEANCTLSGGPTGGPSTSAPTTRPTVPPTPSPTAAPTSPSTQRPSPGETLPNGCPADFGEELLLPHEYDCGQYYQCVHGNRVLRPCAIGSHFSYNHQDCVSPDEANCTLSGGPTASPSTIAPTTRPTVPSTPAPTEAPTAPTSQRPSPSTAAPTTRPTAPTTPSPTAAPTLPSTQRPSPSTSAPTTTPTAPPTPAPTAAPTSPSTQRPSPGETLPNGCPADFSEELLLPHEYDCGQYYQCVHGNRVLRPCSIGLHFSYKYQDCVYPEIANCSLTGGSTEVPSTNSPSSAVPTSIPTAPPTAAPTTASTTTGAQTEGPSSPAPTAPPTALPTTSTTSTTAAPGGGDGNDDKCKTGCNVPHWPHETECDKFWSCNGDQKVLGVCSTGLHFNPQTQTCDFICNVSCERKSVQANYNADGLSVFLPWEKVDELAERNNLSEIRNIGLDFL